MRSTPSRRATATGALIAAAAMFAVGVQTGPASAGAAWGTAAPKGQAAGQADPGALPADLSPAQRTALIRAADAGKAETAKELGLGAQEKLVVRDVTQDRDGTTHTRYERTYAGLPVLGGDLLVTETKAGRTEAVAKAARAELKNVDLSADVAPAAAEKQALGAARAEGSKATEAQQAPRKVVWLAQGKPVLAYETVVGGLQHDGTPNELHVVTDAATGAKLYEWQAVHNGTGNTQYSGQVTLGTAQSGSNFTLTDTARGSHKTYNLNRGTSGTGTLFSGSDDVWGDGTPTNLETAGADAHYGAALTWDYYKNVHGRSGIRGDGVGAYSRVHYGNNYVNAFWQDSCFCMTYGDGSGNAKPLTSIDVAAHE
ncbi:M4 family metallopeptidase, partial [Streptomyces kanasensis]